MEAYCKESLLGSSSTTFEALDHGPTGSFRLSTQPTYRDDSSIVAPHPSQRSAMPSAEQFCGDALIITQDPRARGQVVGTNSRGQVPIGVPVSVETPTFVGHMCNSIRGWRGTPQAEFRGTKLLGKSIIQGMFKQPTPAKDLWVGQELLNKPLLPASFQRLVFTTAAKLFSNTCRVMVEGDEEAVGYLNPLLAMAAVINVSLPGQQPDLRAATEDVRLLNSSLVDKSGQPLSSSQRQRFYDKPSNLAGAVFRTNLVYTFVIDQSIVNMEAYRLKLGAFINLDLCAVLNGQPLQLMCKNVQSNELIVGLLAWHKHLNYSKHDSDTDSSCGHSTASSLFGAGRLHTSSSSTLSSMGSGDSLFSNSCMGSSIGSLSDSSGDSEAGEQCSECAQSACEAGSDAGCDSDYHSCIEEEEEAEDEQLCHWSGVQQDVSGDSSSSTGSNSSSMCTNKQTRALETAFSAPAGFDFGAAACDSVSDDAIAADQGAGMTAAQGACAGGSRPKSGVKAAAALASAARRMAERFKPRRAAGVRRSHKSCSGAGV